MKRTSPIEVCTTLERRAAARLRAALAQVKRCVAARDEEAQRLLAVRARLALAQRWPANSCAFFDLRERRAAIATARFTRDMEDALRCAAAHEEERKRWGALARGLQRRERRRVSKLDPTWRN